MLEIVKRKIPKVAKKSELPPLPEGYYIRRPRRGEKIILAKNSEGSTLILIPEGMVDEVKVSAFWKEVNGTDQKLSVQEAHRFKDWLSK